MADVSPFARAERYRNARIEEWRGVQMAGTFGAPADEYRAAREQAALFDRSDRGRLLLTGTEVKSWLHNLVTNAVEPLEDGAGCYAFTVDVKGRILFDLNILSVGGTLWLDLDRLLVASAAAHFDRYLFTEDVKIEERSAQDARLACSGPRAPDLAATLGVRHLATMPLLASVALDDESVVLIRHDLAGELGFELVLPQSQAHTWWDRLAGAGARPTGVHVLDALRIEAGLPWPGQDLDDRVLPAETGQAARGVSYDKGCYLGQEIIERMRSRGVLAKRLVRLTTHDGAGLALPAVLRQDGIEVGRITSLVKHPVESHWVGLAYVKTPVTDFVGITAGKPPRQVTIRPLH